MASILHVCTAEVPAAKPGHLRKVCGLCWFVHENCKCYAVDDLGTVMRERDRTWTAWRGNDLLDRNLVGHFRTRREAVAALRDESHD